MRPTAGPSVPSPRRRGRRVAALLGAGLILASCASPMSRNGDFAERELARREAQVQRGLAGERDLSAEADVSALACRLLPDRCRALRLYVVDSEVPQARAYGNGMLLVHGALFTHLDDEAELAFALGHELAHLALGHFQPGRSASGRSGSRQSAALEQDADAWATRRLAALGYRQDAGLTLLTRLAREGHLGEEVAQRRLRALRDAQ